MMLAQPSSAPETAASGSHDAQVRGACALDCPDACAWIVTVRDGRAVRLRGDPDHPFTRGALCNKVVGYLQHTKSPERILYPMRRVGRKGAGEFTRISWDEALATIARRFQDAIAAHGAESVWPYLGSGSMGLLQGIYGAGHRFWNVLGASQHLYNLCTIAGGAGTGYTLGDNRVGMDPEAFRFSKLVLLWGANVLSTHPHLWRWVLEARRSGAFVVAIDPIRTRTAAACDWHLMPMPGTDAALALGLMHVVLGEGRADDAYIDSKTVGWDQFRERILEFPPARVANITGLPVDTIIVLGKRLAEARPTGIRIGIGLQRHGGGGMAVRTISCIPGVTGDWQYPGGGVHYDTRGFFGVNWPALWRDDLRARPARTLLASRTGEVLLETGDPPVKVLFLYAANPLASAPRQSQVRAGLARDDLFMVVVEHFLTDTAKYADLLLPATMQVEHADLLMSYGHMYIAWNAPAVPPAGECLSTSELFRRLAGTMGLEAPALFDSDEDMARQVLDSGHASLAGITLDALKARGWMRLNYPDPFVPFTSGFPTPSGKLEFVSERMAQAGLDPVAGYVPSLETAQQDTALARAYPLALVTPASHYLLNSTFGNVAAQQLRSGPPTVLIHPHDAEARGLVSGDEVRVANLRGAFYAAVDVTERVRPGVVASTKGRWLRDLRDESNVNATVDGRLSDLGSGAVYHDNRVEIARAG